MALGFSSARSSIGLNGIPIPNGKMDSLPVDIFLAASCSSAMVNSGIVCVPALLSQFGALALKSPPITSRNSRSGRQVLVEIVER